MANNNNKGNKRNFKDKLNDEKPNNTTNNDTTNNNTTNNNIINEDISHNKNKVRIVNKKQLADKKQLVDKKQLSETSDDENDNIKNVENNFENMLSTLIKDFDPNKNPWQSEPIIIKAPLIYFFQKITY